MKMHPPAQINARVTDERLRWLMAQPIVIKLPPDAKIPDTWKEQIKHNAPLEGTLELPDIQDYKIDDLTKNFILYELQRILSFHRFNSELLDNGSLKISKERWTLEVDNILGQLPFTESFLAQIESSYNYHVQDAAFTEMVFSGGVMMQVDYGLPRPSRFIDMREILEDFINDNDKD